MLKGMVMSALFGWAFWWLFTGPRHERRRGSGLGPPTGTTNQDVTCPSKTRVLVPGSGSVHALRLDRPAKRGSTPTMSHVAPLSVAALQWPQTLAFKGQKPPVAVQEAAAGGCALPTVDLFAVGKRDAGGFGDDVVLIRQAHGRESTVICVVADGSTHGHGAVSARALAALVAEGCMELAAALTDARASVLLEQLLEWLPGYLRRYFPAHLYPTHQLAHEQVLRSCAVVVAVASATRIEVAGIGDCCALLRRKRSTTVQEVRERARGEISAVWIAGGGLRFRVHGGFAASVEEPAAVYLCSDGAHGAYFSLYPSSPEAFDRARWSQLLALTRSLQEPGTVRNDDMTAVRLLFP